MARSGKSKSGSGRKSAGEASELKAPSENGSNEFSADQSGATVDVVGETTGSESIEEPMHTQSQGNIPGKILSTLAGGIAAGGLGFLTSQYLGNDRWPFRTGELVTEKLAVQIDAQADVVRALEEEIQTLTSQLATKSDSAELAALNSSQETAAQSTADIVSSLSDLQLRLGDLENRPVPDIGATERAVDIYSEELTAMRAMFENELARIEAAQIDVAAKRLDADAVFKTKMVQAAISQIQVAAQNGLTFENSLNDLREAGIDVSPELGLVAISGIPSLAALRDDFASAARLALAAAAKEQADSGQTSGVAAFFRNQLGARSLKPQEGTGADAVLSRAEAAVGSGDISGALAEISTLSDAGLDQMKSWTDQAQSHLDSMGLISALTASIGD